jgi:hypothetical protein
VEKRGEFFDYDPLTGLEERYEETPDGMMHLHTYQDVAPIIDHCKALANDGGPDEAWRKNGVAVYAKLPMVVAGQMMKKGIRVFDQNHVQAVVREVNQNYPWLKTTTKHHEVKQR